MRRRLFLLLLEFVAITVPLVLLWKLWGHDAYLDLFRALARPFLELLGVKRIPAMLVGSRFVNYLPFFALMMVTPGLTARRRGIGTLAGFALIFAWHIGFTAIAYHVMASYGTSAKAFSALFPALLFSDSLPFVLWAVISHEFLRDVGTHAWRKIARPSAGTGD
jgi:hypothetical protein